MRGKAKVFSTATRWAAVFLLPAFLAGSLYFAGCASVAEPNVPHVVVAPTGPATSAEIVALSEQIARLKESFKLQTSLSQTAAGAVWAAAEANSHNPAGLPKEATAAQLDEAARALPAATDAQKLEKANQNARILAGELAAVRLEMGQKASEIDQLKADKAASDNRVAELASQLAGVSAAGLKERTEAAAKLQSQFNSFSVEIEKANQRTKEAKDEARNQVAREQVAWLNRTAAGCAAAAVAVVGLAAFFGGLAAIRAAAPFAALLLLASLTSFGLAQIVGAWWFKWAALSATGIGFGLCAWWAVKHYQLGTLQSDTKEKAAKLTGILHQTVPVLDEAYNKASADVKSFMDEHIFSQLNSRMDAATKAAVHEVRAEVAQQTPRP